MAPILMIKVLRRIDCNFFDVDPEAALFCFGVSFLLLSCYRFVAENGTRFF